VVAIGLALVPRILTSAKTGVGVGEWRAWIAEPIASRAAVPA
jgi:hypothetical protein